MALSVMLLSITVKASQKSCRYHESKERSSKDSHTNWYVKQVFVVSKNNHFHSSILNHEISKGFCHFSSVTDIRKSKYMQVIKLNITGTESSNSIRNHECQ